MMDNPAQLFDDLVARIGKKWRCTSPKEFFITVEFFNDDGSLFVSGEGMKIEDAIAEIEKKL